MDDPLEEMVHAELLVVKANFTRWTSQVLDFTTRSQVLYRKKILQDKIGLFIVSLEKRLMVQPCTKVLMSLN